MVTIKFLKETETMKVGEVAETSKASAEHAVSQGFAEYVIDETTKKKVNSTAFDNIKVNKNDESLKPKVKQNINKPKDESRSAKEFGQVCKLINQGKTMNEVFEHMIEYPKWMSAGYKYQEITYKNALKKCSTPGETLWLYKLQHDEDYPIWEENSKGVSKINRRNLVKLIIKKAGHFITIGHDKPMIYYYKDGHYKNNGRTYIRKLILALTKGYVTSYNINEAITHIQTITTKERNEIKEPVNEICVNNGILNLDTGELQEHTPNKIFLQKICIDYIPGIECPTIKEFLSDVLEECDIPTIQEFFGFLLYKSYFIKKAMLCYGEHDSGKTQFLKLCVAFVGHENISGVSLHKISYDRFACSNLQGKLLNIYDDLSFKDIKDTGSFKIATGGGYVSAEKKFGEMFSFINYAKLLFATNKIASIDEDDPAYYSRWLIIPFNNQFLKSNPKTDRNIIEKITTKKELQGLLNYALDGLKRLRDNGSFAYSRTIDENRNIMERSNNSLAAFVQDSIYNRQGAWISKEDFYRLYSEYCSFKGMGRFTMDKVGKTLIDKASFIVDSPKKLKGKQHRGWLNVGVGDTCDSFSKIIYNENNNTYSYINFICLRKRNKDVIGVTDFVKEPKKEYSAAQQIAMLDPSDEYEAQELCETYGEEAVLRAKENGDIFESKPGRFRVL